ncbi:MAG TPA: DUF5060 domain-containing protein [Verrucomicrobiae bacterium]
MSFDSRTSAWGRAGAMFCALTVSAQGADSERNISLESATNRVGKYEKIEFQIAVPNTYTNPFDPDEVEVNAQLRAPSGQAFTVPAFWGQPYERRRVSAGGTRRDWLYPIGQAGWRLRFAPSETGAYTAVATLRDKRGLAKSAELRFDSVASAGKGFLRASRKDARFFEFSEGGPFFAIGQNLAFIGEQQYLSLTKAEEVLGRLSENGANYVRVWTCCEDWAMAIEARKSAFGRSWDWRPQIVAEPGDEASGRKCLGLTPRQNSLRVDPSHPVAVRADTRYVLSGRARLGPGAALRLEAGGTAAGLPAGGGPTGEWRGFKHEFQTGAGEQWLRPVSFRLDGDGNAWIADLSLKEAAGGPELLWEADVNRPLRGFYNQLDCYMLDELVTAAGQHRVFVQLCLLTRDLYMSALKDPASPEYERAIRDARKVLRYAVARWGYSTVVAAWEYWNEMDPGLPTDKFYTALGEYLAREDPYGHLRTTSTWGPSAKDCRHQNLDVADTHFYLRPSDKGRLEDEVAAVLERTRWLREQAPAKPAHLGEFGLANEKWQPRPEATGSAEVADLHNALWSSALSGASGTAMFWWWERLDQRNFYPHYRSLSRFIAEVPWTGGELRSITARCSEPRVRVVGLVGSGRGCRASTAEGRWGSRRGC